MKRENRSRNKGRMHTFCTAHLSAASGFGSMANLRVYTLPASWPSLSTTRVLPHFCAYKYTRGVSQTMSRTWVNSRLSAATGRKGQNNTNEKKRTRKDLGSKSYYYGYAYLSHLQTALLSWPLLPKPGPSKIPIYKHKQKRRHAPGEHVYSGPALWRGGRPNGRRPSRRHTAVPWP